MATRVQLVCRTDETLTLPPVYCVDSPLEVFGEVYNTHKILSYKGFQSPVGVYYNNWGGLVIQQVESAKGTMIFGQFDDFKSEFDEAKLSQRDSNNRTEQRYLQAIRHTLMSVGEDPVDCFNKMKEGDEYWTHRYRDYQVPALEVASVTLGIENPTCHDLERILKGK
ncbi:hypothetical protein GOV03_02555 [Candidatus Woesearchaeota archaeon]|nr:hypothetical protein [Candidatus Woesearchaeota archaeon]